MKGKQDKMFRRVAMYGEYGKVAAALAQSVERKPFKLVAEGSGPSGGT